MKPLDYMSFKNGILQDWVKEAKYDYDIKSWRWYNRYGH